MSQIYSIAYQPESMPARAIPDQFNRVSVQYANLIADYGIEGDRKAGRNPERQINIVSYETLEQMHARGLEDGPGMLGEQIVVSGLDIGVLEKGDQLVIGDGAVVEVTFHRTSCKRLQQIRNTVHEFMTGDLGIFVRVIAGGEVFVGDQVSVMKAEKRVAVER